MQVEAEQTVYPQYEPAVTDASQSNLLLGLNISERKIVVTLVLP